MSFAAVSSLAAQSFSTNFSDSAINDNGRARVLIVDDERVVCDVFADCLAARFECVTAQSAAAALREMAEKSFAVVITDVMMPGLSGVELLRKIVATYADTTVIVVSGVNNPQRALDTIRLGAFDYLIKPCDLSGLETTVERALKQRELRLNARFYKQDLEARNRELANQKSALERLQAQIVHSEKMASLGQLAAGIAHEINNPLGFIRGNLDILREAAESARRLMAAYDQLDLSPAQQATIKQFKQNADYAATFTELPQIVDDCGEGATRISDIVQNLRTFCRLDEAEFRKTDVNEGLDSTLRLLSSYYTIDNVRLVKNYGRLPQIDSFAAQLNQVWMNLLVNAAQSLGRRGGTITLTTTHDETRGVCVKISDDGGGIAPEHLPKIFDPFFTTKPVGEGTGLGLSIAFGIVERHGGRLTVDSKLYRGTTFTVTLPVSKTTFDKGFLIVDEHRNS